MAVREHGPASARPLGVVAVRAFGIALHHPCLRATQLPRRVSARRTSRSCPHARALAVQGDSQGQDASGRVHACPALAPLPHVAPAPACRAFRARSRVPGMEKPYQLRFRHLDGDVGPLAFEEPATVAAMKVAVFEAWPSAGPLAIKVRAHAPTPLCARSGAHNMQPTAALLAESHAQVTPRSSYSAAQPLIRPDCYMRPSLCCRWRSRATCITPLTILALQKPESDQHLRVMYQGKILQDVLSIADLKQLPGDIVPERLVTLHLVIAQPGQLNAVPNRRPANERSEGGCCSIQ